MVFKPLLTLARQNFAKSFVNGYAQSAVAAAQSSYASSATLPLVWNGPHSNQKPYQPFGGRSDFSTSQRHDSAFAHDRRLVYDAHKRKLIIASSTSPNLIQSREQIEAAEEELAGTELSRPVLKRRSASTSCIREFSTSATTPQLTNPEGQVAAEAILPELLLDSQPKGQQLPSESNHAVPPSFLHDKQTAVPPSAEEEISSDLSGETLVNISDKQKSELHYIASMEKANNDGRFEDVQTIFNKMVNSGIAPTTVSYDYVIHAKTQTRSTSVADILEHVDKYHKEIVASGLPLSAFTYSILISTYAHYYVNVDGVNKRFEEYKQDFGFWDSLNLKEIEVSSKNADILDRAMVLLQSAADQGHNVTEEALNTLFEAVCSKPDISSLVQILQYTEATGRQLSMQNYYNMIKAFGKDKDLQSAVDVFKTASTLPEKDQSSRDIVHWMTEILEGKKGMVVSRFHLNVALAYAYILSGEEANGQKFFEKVIDQSPPHIANQIRQMFLVDAYIENQQPLKAYEAILNGSNEQIPKNISALLANKTIYELSRLGNQKEAEALHQYMDHKVMTVSKKSALKLVHMYSSSGNGLAIQSLFEVICLSLEKTPRKYHDLEYLSIVVAVSLIKLGAVDEAMKSFTQGMILVKRSEEATSPVSGVSAVLRTLEATGGLSQLQSLSLMKVYGLAITTIPSDLARKLLAPFDGVPPESLTPEHFHLLVSAQSAVACSSIAEPEDIAKLEYMFGLANRYQLPLWNFPAKMVEQFEEQQLQQQTPITPVGLVNVTLQDRIMNSQYYGPMNDIDQETLMRFGNPQSHVPPAESYILSDKNHEGIDPYADSISAEKSTIVNRKINVDDHFFDRKPPVASLEHMRGVAQLYKASRGKYRFFPQTVTRTLAYFAKVGGKSAVHLDMNDQIHKKEDNRLSAQEQQIRETALGHLKDVFKISLAAIPFQKEYKRVRYAWYSIYDSMIAASLQLGDVAGAEALREEMISLGASPSANTYGLFIVHLKSSPHNYDEATEAVRIFERSKSENVAPTSFLYNALIGKLSKARRIDDCLMYFSEMRALGIRPTSITYGTIVNALVRVSDQRFAEELFDEMESMPNYKPRAAPYNSMIQFFVHTKADQARALDYFNRMLKRNITPTAFTYKLVMDAYSSCEPYNVEAATSILEEMRKNKVRIGGIHYGSLIQGIGIKQKNVEGARKLYDDAFNNLHPDAPLFQNWAECFTINDKMDEVTELRQRMAKSNIQLTPYIANALIAGYAKHGNLQDAEKIYNELNAPKMNRREPSTYETMVRAYLVNNDHDSAMNVVNEMAGRLYPAPVMTKIVDLLRWDGRYDVDIAMDEPYNDIAKATAATVAASA